MVDDDGCSGRRQYQRPAAGRQRGNRRRLRARSSWPAAASLIAVVAPSARPTRSPPPASPCRWKTPCARPVSARAPSSTASIAPARRSATRRSVSPTTASPPRPHPAVPGRDQATDNGQNRNLFAISAAPPSRTSPPWSANPLDLLYPRGLTPADAVRRAAVLAKYRNGDVFTSRLLSRETGGAVAQGVGTMSDIALQDTRIRRRRDEPAAATAGDRCAAGAAHLHPGVLRVAGYRPEHRGRRRRPAHGACPCQGSCRRPRRRQPNSIRRPRRPT